MFIQNDCQRLSIRCENERETISEETTMNKRRIKQLQAKQHTKQL